MADPALLIAVGGELDRIRAQAERAIAQVWDALPGTPRALIGEWVDVAAPILDGVAQAAVAVTDAYLARALADQPLGITVPEATAALGGGIPTEQILERPFLRTWHHLNMGATYEIARQAGRTYATSIAAGAVSRSHFGAMHASLDSRPWVQGYRRVVSGAGACDFCLTIAGNTYSRADIAPAHRGCVVEGTVVSSSGATAASRRWYEGEGVLIGTAAGHFLTVTPNHPVLTPRGWVAAELLREGDNVLRCADGQRVRPRVPHEHEAPALIEDRFRALAMSRLVAVPLAAEDFHGDGPHPEVDVVPADRLLWRGSRSERNQHLEHLALAVRLERPGRLTSERSLDQMLLGGTATSRRIVGASGLGCSFCGRHPSRPVLPRLRSVADRHPGRHDVATHHRPGDPVLRRQLELGLAGLIAGGDVIAQGNGSRANRHASSVEFGSQRRGLHADGTSSIPHSLASQVELDPVVLVRRVDLATHVLNLQTGDGYYAANGIIVSNCDCIVEPIPGREYAASRPGTAARNVGQVIDRRGAPIPAARLEEARAQFSRSGGKPVARPRATVTT